MRIGIDCRPLIGPMSGIGYYLWEIINQWGELDIPHELLLYGPRDFTVPEGLAMSNVRYRKRIVRIRPSELWMHTVAPLQILRDRIDVFWGPNYAMPLFPIGTPAVLTIHDMVYRVLPGTMRWKTYLHNRYGLEKYVRRCQKIIVPSDCTKKDVLNFLDIHEGKVVVTPLGASHRFSRDKTNDAHLLQQLGLVNRNYFVAVGTMEPRKNVGRVVTAFKAMAEKLPVESRPNLVIIGGSGWGGVARQFESMDDDSIRYLGYVTDDELGTLYRSAYALIYVPLYEGFGLPPLEAMSIGCPVIVSDTSSLPEVVGESGLYVNPENVGEIEMAVEKLWTNPSLHFSLSRQGVARASGMTWGRTAERTLEVLLHEAAIGGEGN